MARLILLIAIAVLAVTALRWVRQLSPPERRRYAAQIVVAALLCLLLLLVATGRLHWLGALLVAAIPLARQLLPLLARALPALRAGGPRRSGSSAAGRQSTATTATLRMTLDHASGRIAGQVSAGPFAGRDLDSLDRAELLALHRYCRQHDGDAAELLETYLNQRLGPDWQADQTDAEQHERRAGEPHRSRSPHADVRQPLDHPVDTAAPGELHALRIERAIAALGETLRAQPQVAMIAPVTCATRCAATRPASDNACPLRTSIAGSPLRSACATRRTVSGATAALAGTGNGSATRPPSFQAVSAGSISVAICPGAVIAAWTAAAPSAPTRCAEALVRTQCEAVRARPSVLKVSGESNGR